MQRFLTCACSFGAALTALAIYATTAQGSVFSWDGSSGAQFTSTANWTPDGVPGALDTGTFRLGNVPAYPVWLFTGLFIPINATVNRMIVGTNSPGFAGGVLTVASPDAHETGRGLIIGETATDLAIVNCGLQGLTTRYGTLGVSPGCSGTLNLSAGYFNVTGTAAIYDLIAGLNGSGAINVSAGADVSVTDDTVLGQNAIGVGSVSVAGAGSTWTSSGAIIVGNLGVGNLSVTNQALLSGPSVSLAELAGSSATVTVSGVGSSLTGPSTLVIGEAGNGSFDLTQGAQVNCTDGHIAKSATSTGTLNVSGPGSTWTSTRLFVSEPGTGTMNISNGARVTNSLGTYLGSVAGTGIGSAYVSGLGSTWINLGSLDIGRYGHGVLELSAGGRLDVAGSSALGRNPGSTGQAVITGANTIWTSSNLIYVGLGGVGSLEIGAGGTLRTDHNLYVGASVDASGTLVISGAGSVLDIISGCPLSCVSLQISSQGNGELQINNGGHANSDVGLIGGDLGSNGTAFIDGAGSEWSMGKYLRIGRVGGSGPGALTVTSQGSARAPNVSIYTDGEVHGDGNIVGDVANDGLVSPGTSAGPLHVDGDYNQTSDGELRIELASASSYDQLLITGAATLGGTLSVQLSGGFTPTGGQSYTILTAPTVASTFAIESLPTVPGLLFDVVYNPQSVVLNVSSDPTAVDLPPGPRATYGLDGAVPNPFNPATTIGFRTASAQFVELDVYDLGGRLVKRLVAESLPAGEHSIAWNGRDGSGRSVSGGVYLYRLRAGKFEASKRMVLAN